MAPGFLAFSLIIAHVSFVQGRSPLEVHVDVDKFGKVDGFRELDVISRKNVDCFLGIPFARPPTGNLRFKPPEPLPPPDDASKQYDATQLPASCYQIVDTMFESRFVDTWNPNTNMSEDCLYLNIWKPQGAQNKAVLVWIFGGGFTSGTSTLDLYDGKVLAAKGDVVVVSMQYRVGALGFLSIGSESAPGNAGLLDQQLALRWIHEHVAAFGGNPQQVTIFGESAGAASVGLHLLSPGSDDLFRSAVMQSAAAGAHWAFVETEEAKRRSYKLAELVGCSRDNAIECMREKSADLLTKKQVDVDPVIYFNFVPVVDHKFLEKSPLELLKSGEFQRKNIMLGMNSHEGSYFIIYDFPTRFDPLKSNIDSITAEEYREMVKKLKLVNTSSDAVIDTIAAVYSLPCGSEGNSNDVDAKTYLMSLDGMFGDSWFKCPVVHTAKTYATKKETDVYVYAFNHRTSGSPWPEWAGDALHGYEIDHVFGVPHRADSRNKYSNEERTLSDQIMTYWTNFAKTGNPNQESPTQHEWPKYTIDERRVLVLDTSNPLRPQTGLRDRHCHFWSESVPALLPATDADSSGQVSAMFGSISLLLTAVVAVIAVLVL